MGMMIAKPENDIFVYTPTSQARIAVQAIYPPEGGILVYYKGHPFPEKLFAFPEAIYCIDPVKRAVWNTVKLFSRFPLLKKLLGLLLVWPGGKDVISEAVKLFFNFAENTLSKIYLKPERYCESGRELYRAGMETIAHLGLSKDWTVACQQLVRVFCTLWEFDNAYRYRFQDGFSSLDKNKFKSDPVAEINRVAQIMSSREDGDLSKKWAAFSSQIKFLFYFKKLDSALKYFVDILDLDKIKMDINDQYWSYHRADYDFAGLTLEERIKIRVKLAEGRACY